MSTIFRVYRFLHVQRSTKWSCLLVLTHSQNRSCNPSQSSLFLQFICYNLSYQLTSQLIPAVFQGMVITVALVNIQHVDMQSSRNLLTLAISLMLGMMLPKYLNDNPDAIRTGTSEYETRMLYNNEQLK